jgi:hypothetical protein
MPAWDFWNQRRGCADNNDDDDAAAAAATDDDDVDECDGYCGSHYGGYRNRQSGRCVSGRRSER